MMQSLYQEIFSIHRGQDYAEHPLVVITNEDYVVDVTAIQEHGSFGLLKLTPQLQPKENGRLCLISLARIESISILPLDIF